MGRLVMALSSIHRNLCILSATQSPATRFLMMTTMLTILTGRMLTSKTRHEKNPVNGGVTQEAEADVSLKRMKSMMFLMISVATMMMMSYRNTEKVAQLYVGRDVLASSALSK